MMKNWKSILLLAGPSILSFASMTLTGTINLIMVGQMGALVIAVVGVSNIIIYNAWALTSGIGNTMNYMVAQNYGANDMKKAMSRVSIALGMAFGLGIAISCIGYFAAGDILKVVGGTASSGLTEGEEYLRIRFYAMALGIISFVFHGFFRGIGDTKTPMIASLAGNLMMIFFTYCLTYGHLGFAEFGLQGAGWAVWIGEAAGLAYCLFVYFIKLHRKYHTRSKVAFDLAECKLIIKESGKLGIQEFAMSISMLIFTMFVAYLGPDALAANEVSLSIMSLGFMPAFGFGSTATILVGQKIGQSEPLQARRAGTDTAIMGSLFLLIIGLVEFLAGDQIAHIYTDDPNVYHLAGYLITISAFLQLFDGFLNFYAGGLRGIGDTTFLLVTSFILGLFLFVPLAYVMIFVVEWGSVGAWLALYSYLVVFGLTVMIRYYRTDWMNVRIKVADQNPIGKAS